jgi:gliding motility-associated-like protein
LIKFIVFKELSVNFEDQQCNGLEQIMKISFTLLTLIICFFSGLSTGLARTFNYVDSCLGSQTAFTIDDLSGVTSVAWDFGDPASGSANTSTLTAPTHQFSSSGFFNVSVTINGGAENIIKQVQIYPLPTTSNSLLYACKGITVILKTDTQNVMKRYEWVTTATTQSITFKLTRDTTFWVYNYDHRECRAKGYFWIKAFEINPDFNINQPNQCLNGNSFVFTNLTLDSHRPWMQYFWSFGDAATANSKDASHVYGNAGAFPVTLVAVPQDTFVCADTTTRLVNVFNQVLPDFDYDVNRCKNLVTFTNTSGPAQNYFWDFGNGKKYFVKDTTEKYPSSGKYTVVLFTNVGTSCTDSLSLEIDITVADSLIFIPNAFSPNNDSINSTFKVVGLDYECYPYVLKIYNRWGEQIFTSESLAGEPFWNGMYNGLRVQQGVYYYTVIGKHFTKSGTLTVLP